MLNAFDFDGIGGIGWNYEHQPFLLNPGNVWSSRLKNVEAGEQKRGLQDFAGSQIFRSAVFRHLDTPKVICHLKNLDDELEKLAKMGKSSKTPAWFRHGVEMVLSPDQLKLVLKGRLDSHFQDYIVLSDPQHPTAFLYVSPRRKPATTRFILRDILLVCNDPYPIQLAPANGDFAIEITEKDMPFKLLSDYRESKVLIFSENDYFKDRPRPMWSLHEHLEDEFLVSIKSLRAVNHHDKKWLATWLRRPHLEHHDVSIVEFHSVDERNTVARHIESLPLLLVDGVIDKKRVYEETLVQISYDLTMSRAVGVRLVVHQEQDINEAGHYFRIHGVHVTWKNATNTLELRNLPAHLRTQNDKLWFVKKVCNTHNIRTTEIEPIWTNRDTSTVPTEEQLMDTIDHCLLKICRLKVRLMPVRGVLLRDIDLTDAPWFKVAQMAEQNLNVTCYFETGEKGLKVLRELMKPEAMEELERDNFGAELAPMHRKYFSITRSMRAMFNAKIEKFDEMLRFKFYNLSEQNDKVMENPGSYYCVLRVFEKWETHEELGFIGVEGWEPPLVQMYLEELQKTLEPLVYEENEELMYGVGEQYAKWLERKWRVLVDVDKFQQRISLFGDEAEQALEDLKKYATSKSSIEVSLTINGKFFNNIEHIRERKFWHNAGLYGANWIFLPYEKSIEFQGTIELFEKLMRALENYSANVRKRCMERREKRVELECPICMMKIEGRDWYRQTCGHLLCRDCANGQLRADVQAKRFNCKVCDANWAPMDIMRLILGGESRLLELDTQKLQAVMPLFHQTLLTIRNLDIQSCPTPDCLGIRRPGPAEQRCSICSHDYCGHCLEPRAPEHQCPPHGENYAMMDEQTRRYMERSTKQCSACGAAVEKNGGCNHIECQCGAHFCYICGFNAAEPNLVYHHIRREHNVNEHILGGGLDDPIFMDPDMAVEHLMAMAQFYGHF